VHAEGWADAAGLTADFVGAFAGGLVAGYTMFKLCPNEGRFSHTFLAGAAGFFAGAAVVGWANSTDVDNPKVLRRTFLAGATVVGYKTASSTNV
jgi:hypothetical protein